MKYMNCFLAITGILLLSFCGVSAQTPVQWSAKAERVAAGKYLVKINMTIGTGWRVYADDDKEAGLTNINLAYNHEGLQAGKMQCTSLAKKINDALFAKSLSVFTGNIVLIQSISFQNSVPATLKIILTGFASNGKEFQPIKESKIIQLQGGKADFKASNIKLSSVNLLRPVADCGGTQGGENGMLGIFFLSMAGGLLALLTPCVFPMIPLTVSFFTAQSASKNRGVLNGILYGFFIFLIYTLASLPFHLLTKLDPEIFNVFSTNIWVNLVFFFLFVAFALSFFGLFEITLPSWLGNAADSKSSLGSISGIFFMALTLALVSFSCTGPILGTLLVSSLSSGAGAWMLTAGMAGFGLALALPFALFAMFPNWMQKLPKSGGWLDTVKKVLAFVELAMAFKFLSNADLVAHWGLLKREIFIGLWALIALAAALYLFRIIHLPHDAKKVTIGKGRLITGIVLLSVVVYLIPGVTNTSYADLKFLSGFPPPLSYSIYKRSARSNRINAQVINDFDQALKLAKEQHKPLLIDFTGWACVNCRKMEENVWTKPEISAIIKDNFILVSLYVDDRKVLPQSLQFTFKGAHGEKEIITNGDKWATFEAVNFGQVTQPLYVILNNDEKLMNHPVGYTPDETAYLKWLQCGLNASANK